MKRMQLPGAYHYGHIARENGKPKTASPYPALSKLWAWWVAGWNDADIEEGQKK